jgi:hypothetical protein
MVDWKKVKKEFIPANEVPGGHGAQNPAQWDELFSGIPKGQALVLHEPEINSGTIRNALRRTQKDGKFKNLRVSTKGIHGRATIYITNTEATPARTITRRADSTSEKLSEIHAPV